jgi:NADH dehydrogenase/NADH:ubiquinone oxidoreductase subunit G
MWFAGYYFNFWYDRGRFYERLKKSVDNLDIFDSFIKTIMTRCIHCTRCVRYFQELSGDFTLGIIGRGSSMEIGTYVFNSTSNELSGM